MSGGERFDFFDKHVGVVGSDAELRHGEIEPAERNCTEPHVSVRVGNAGNDGTAMKIDDFTLGLLETRISASEPTASMRVPVIARACAHGDLGFPV